MYIFLFLPILFFSGYLFAEKAIFSWPIQTDSIKNRLTSLFGESRVDHFHNGVDISSDNEAVRAMGDGVLLYSRYEDDSPFSNEAGSGNCVWLGHKEGFLSGYFHLKDGREDGLLEKEEVHSGEVIGKSGNTGHSSGSHLHFIVAKENGKKIINPLPLLPFAEDKRPPQISQLILTIGDKYTYINDGDNINISQSFPVSVPIIDSVDKAGMRRGVKKIEFYFNRKLLKTSNFNEISLKGKYWVNEDGLKFNDLFYQGNYYIGDLNLVSGENIIKINAYDFNENKTTKSYAFNVTRIK
ncbi:MAG: M23 family metallopeptidase [Leptospiraceae bacterium]|nr:M23 family metallopeptidase [Leptospiraceae bacterium]